MTHQAYVLHDYRLAVFWARKAACTSIVDAIMFDIMRKDQADFGPGRLRKRVWLADEGYRYDHRAAVKLVRTGGYRSIAMIREPYARLVSIFLNSFVTHGGKPVRQFDDLPFFAQTFYVQIRRCSLAEAKAEYRGTSFEEFVNAVCDKIERRRNHLFHRGPVLTGSKGAWQRVRTYFSMEPRLNLHWNTQIPFWFLKTGFEYQHLYNTDQSGSFFQKLGELTDKSVTEKHSNKSRGSREGPNPAAESLIDQTTLEYAGDPAAMNKARFSSDSLRLRVRQTFIPDYHYYQKTLQAGG